ncbi:MAG: prohead protease/major capsid protein fusion protein, partial [Steroidobacteraceae bacterium]
MPKNQVVQMPMEQLRAPISSVNAEARTFEVQWLSGARVKRMDWMSGELYMLEFSKDAGACRLGRLKAGTAPVLNAHNQYTLSAQLGVVESADYQGGVGTGRVRLSKRDDVKPILQDVQDGIICNVSAGIAIHRLQLLPADAMSEGLPIRLATDFEPMEISFVPIGADAGAGVLSDQQRQQLAMHPCEIVNLTAEAANNHGEPSPMKTPEQLAAEAEAARIKQEQERLAADQERQRIAAAQKEAARVERLRLQLIDDLCTRHTLAAEVRTELSNGEFTPDQIRARVLEELAKQTTPIRSASHADVHIVGDTRLQMRAHMVEALSHRMDPVTVKLTDGGRQYRGMTLLRMAEEVLAAEGTPVRGKSALEMATLAMMSTSDFPNILADVANKRLRQAYEDQMPTYTRWARRAANAPDFKAINVTQLSAAPDLKKVAEGGEFTYGSLSDGKETYAVITYGRIIPITRQAIINDDLNAFDRLPRLFSGSARRLENRLVYGQLLDNPTMSDGGQLFNSTAVTTVGGHANLAGTPSTIDATNLNIGRAAMRKQKGLQSEELNLAPAWLIAGPDKEQVAYQFTSSQYVPAKPSDVNEYRAGGRTALEPVIDAVVTGNQWYLAADNRQVDTVEYCFLDGSEGVYLESQMGFKIDGIE